MSVSIWPRAATPLTEHPSEEVCGVLVDNFKDKRPAGTVVGTDNESGFPRQGIDRERVISVDNGALRIEPLRHPGWGRAALAYGPFERHNGLAFAVFMLNGHNTSQAEPLPDSLLRRVGRWAYGPGIQPLAQRLLRWLLVGQKRLTFRQLVAWYYATQRAVMPLDENLLVGWLPDPITTTPVQSGSAFTVHAGGPTNGNLWVRQGSSQTTVLPSLQNIPLYYIVILREEGAAYYATTLAGAAGLPAYPYMRPLAIDPQGSDSELYATVQQSVLGQIGFRVDTRIYGARVASIASLARWYGTAHAAESGSGVGSLANTMAEVGGEWQVLQGDVERTPRGLRGLAQTNLVLLPATSACGLLHLLVEVTEATDEEVREPEWAVTLVWRHQDHANYWFCQVSSDRSELGLYEQGERQVLCANATCGLRPNVTHALQLTDDGATITVTLNGIPFFAEALCDRRLHTATALGLEITAPSGLYIRKWEAHPRAVALPAALAMGAPWEAQGQRIIVADDFHGVRGPLAATQTQIGNATWQRTLGTDEISLTGQGTAQVVASAQRPAAGRTLYTLPWPRPQLADVAVEILAPGRGRNEGESGRSGLVFWQDARNYLIVNTWLDDGYAGASISSFFHLNGFEDVYDAVWTNVGARVAWGTPYRLRVVFDGMNYLAYVNSEPVLYRALTDVYPKQPRLMIRRVGIAANWEWGTDTGSQFRNFIAKG